MPPPEEPKPKRRVQLLVGYRGRATKERYIAPGLYDYRDERLLGLGKYLVHSGRARWHPPGIYND